MILPEIPEFLEFPIISAILIISIGQHIKTRESKVRLEDKYNSNGNNLERWKCYRCNFIFVNESVAKLHEELLEHKVCKI